MPSPFPSVMVITGIMSTKWSLHSLFDTPLTACTSSASYIPQCFPLSYTLSVFDLIFPRISPSSFYVSSVHFFQCFFLLFVALFLSTIPDCSYDIFTVTHTICILSLPQGGSNHTLASRDKTAVKDETVFQVCPVLFCPLLSCFLPFLVISSLFPVHISCLFEQSNPIFNRFGINIISQQEHPPLMWSQTSFLQT